MLIGIGIVACGDDNGSDSTPFITCETASNPNVTFTNTFTDLDGIAHIEPLGEIQAFHNFSAHTYVFIKPDVATVPIYAPADMDLINVTFNGTDYDIPIHSWCVQGSTTYYLIWEQASQIFYLDLTAGTNYNFSLTIDQWDGTGMVSSGNSGNGRGYTGYDVPCTVEFIYVGE